MAYTLLLITPHWFCTFPLTWYHYGDDSTNEKLRCVCWLQTLHPIPTGRQFVYLFNPIRMNNGHLTAKATKHQLHAQWWTCIHKTACATPEHCDFVTCKQGTVSVYLLQHTGTQPSL
jgi:hypothetical protein